MKKYTPTYFLLPISCSLTAPAHFPCLGHRSQSLLPFIPFPSQFSNLQPSYWLFFYYLCRKIIGSIYLQLMYIWLEGNSSNWPHPWPQLDRYGLSHFPFKHSQVKSQRPGKGAILSFSWQTDLGEEIREAVTEKQKTSKELKNPTKNSHQNPRLEGEQPVSDKVTLQQASKSSDEAARTELVVSCQEIAL